jgi:hypothetical protein
MGTATTAVLRHPPALTNGAIAYLIATAIAVPKQGRSAGIRFAPPSPDAFGMSRNDQRSSDGMRGLGENRARCDQI